MKICDKIDILEFVIISFEEIFFKFLLASFGSDDQPVLKKKDILLFIASDKSLYCSC